MIEDIAQAPNGVAVARSGPVMIKFLERRERCARKCNSASAEVWVVNRQKSVSVTVMSPFSESLLTGLPPPQTAKYLQYFLQAATPCSISPFARKKADVCAKSSRPPCRILPNTKLS